ncbi:Biosynthetic Aromatic amino acid aminotransferase alpha [Klebsiella pneumoniae]|nr:Biosynthetic Aromatic amino acid aminotransferase alpha [Klebsiella pneumoniae]
MVCDNADIAGRVLGQLKATVRRNYSSPPGFGAQVVSQVLNDPELNACGRKKWRPCAPASAPCASRW